MNDAEEIKSKLTAREVFERYGFPVNRRGFCLSPFASEKTPSCKVYDGGRGWHDFSTNKGGDVIDFVRAYFNIPFQDALAKLNDDFCLGLPIGKPLSHQAVVQAQQEAEERRRKIRERNASLDRLQRAYDQALSEFVELDTIKRECAPESPDDPISSAFVYAIKNIDGAAYRLSEAESNLYNFRKSIDF